MTFLRDGNVWVRDLSTGRERQITTDGEHPSDPDAPYRGRYVAPTFEGGPDRVAFLRWTSGSDTAPEEYAVWSWSPRGGVRRSRTEPDVVGLGWSWALGGRQVLRVGPGPSGERNDSIERWTAAEVSLWRAAQTARPRRVQYAEHLFGEPYATARVRASPEGRYLVVPRYVTDASAPYTIWDMRASHPLESLVDHTDWLLWTRGAAFGDGGVYIGVWRWFTRSGNQGSLSRFALDPPHAHKVVAEFPCPWGLAVSTAAHVAAVEVSLWEGDHELWVVDTGTGRIAYLCKGKDPDVWPP